MSKRTNPNLVKRHRSYNTREAANVCGVHINTVRAWLKKGLPVIDDEKPLLILGSDLHSFLINRRGKNKQKCKLCEMYCLRCKAPRRPFEDAVDYEPINATTGSLTAFCQVCTTPMNKYTSLAKLPQIEAQLGITIPRAQKRLNNMDELPLNSDFKQ